MLWSSPRELNIVSWGFNLELQAVSVALTVCTKIEGAQNSAIFAFGDPVQIVFIDAVKS